jgi:hypothetical protein
MYIKSIIIIIFVSEGGLVVRVPGYRSRYSGFDSRRYQAFWEVVCLERGPLSLMSTTEELLVRTSSGFGLENREYCRRDQSRRPRDTLYPLALTSPTSGNRSVSIWIHRLERNSLSSYHYTPFWKAYFNVLPSTIWTLHGAENYWGRTAPTLFEVEMKTSFEVTHFLLQYFPRKMKNNEHGDSLDLFMRCRMEPTLLNLCSTPELYRFPIRAVLAAVT